MTGILIAVAVVAGVGIVIGILLGVAGEKFKVEVDEKEIAVRELLPGNNCGGCGYPGCDGLAAAIAKGEMPPSACPVGGEAVAAKISEVRNVDFLELRACDRSCAGGVLAVANRFLTAERIMKRSMNRDKVPMIYAADNFEALSYLRQHITIRPVQPNPKRLYDGTIDEMLKKMEQVRKLMCYLPGIDCGACGSPNCQSLAEDIVRHEAQFSDCVFMQRNMEKHGKLDQEHAFRIVEKTWGKDRLNKDCYKKGAKYEGL